MSTPAEMCTVVWSEPLPAKAAKLLGPEAAAAEAAFASGELTTTGSCGERGVVTASASLRRAGARASAFLIGQSQVDVGSSVRPTWGVG
jgi:hypothetical protein